jgi:hypothetical protein
VAGTPLMLNKMLLTHKKYQDTWARTQKVAILVIHVYYRIPDEMWHFRGMIGVEMLPELHKPSGSLNIQDYN